MTAQASFPATITDQYFEGERPLYALHDTVLEALRIGIGESALKHGQNLLVRNGEFAGKYPFWHCDGVTVEHSLFRPGARAAIWYSENIRMRGCTIEAPKMFRRMRGLTVENCRFPDAAETLWNCEQVKLRNVVLDGADYVLMNGIDLEVEGMTLQGNYSFQDARNVTVRNSHLASKDAFWGAENVTVTDCVLDGEFLGWHSKNLRLVNCTIRGTQPLCYATDLVMENCRMDENADLAFEYSTLQAEITTSVTSVKNPAGGHIRAPRIGEVILDENCRNPGACKIETAAR
ncbi:hypothetical protein CKO11_02345 [Rhodobacter sp. TJ_12]|uniref:DUF3737 family protein n=1 Tax=Rhodobacter sp. TJ_12 TaxID=2029399 RepID=UPI001CC0F4A7|nr:DUF3737 family protein [Rhodobacter sp. TJ_12]MBZ4021301.1 hypothetical protein [Rhodobacter sp. TJ_12]